MCIGPPAGGGGFKDPKGINPMKIILKLNQSISSFPLRRALYLLALLLVWDFALMAEENGACMLQGFVTDPGGGAVPGVRILLEKQAEQGQRRGSEKRADKSRITDGEGFYCFSEIDAGVYRMRATAEGFGEKKFASVAVVAGAKKHLETIEDARAWVASLP